MKMNKIMFIALTFLAFFVFVSSAYALEGDDINLQTFDDALAERFGISVFAGGILATTILGVMFLIPIAVYTKTVLPPIIVTLLILGFGVAVGWLDVFFMLATTLVIALMFAGKMRDWLGGKGV